MNYGISCLSIIPVRIEPSEKSEMVTQVLFGEHFEIFEQIMGWCRIRLAFDGYEGWIDQKMFTPISERTYHKIEARPFAVTTDVFSLIPFEEEQNVMIAAGSTLPCWRPYKKEFSIGRDVFEMPFNVSYGQPRNMRKMIVNQAMKYFNAPYLWGGRTPLGIDCSGFTQVIYKTAGMKIPRDAGEQVYHGTAISFLEEALPGDLAFFDNEEGEITHVGIVWEKKKIIHASGKVRIDNIDQYGIYNSELHRRTHTLRVIKRIIP